MKYFINILTYDNQTLQPTEGAIVIDLYVQTAADANNNLFARDVMNHPVIKAGIQAYENKYGLSGQIVWQSYGGQQYLYSQDIRCIYQQDNDQTYLKISKFSIKIQFESHSPNSNIGDLYFTCRNDYPAYELAWHRYLLGKVPASVSPKTPSLQDVFVIAYNTSVDVAEVFSITNNRFSVRLNNSPLHIVPIDMNNVVQFHAIPLMDDILITVLGFTKAKLTLQAIPNTECLARQITIDGVKTSIILKKDCLGYTCSTDNDKLTVGYIHIEYLHELQGIARHQLPIDISCLYRYLNDLLLQYRLVTEAFREYFRITTANPTYDRQQIVKEIAANYLTTPPVVDAVLVKLYL